MSIIVNDPLDLQVVDDCMFVSVHCSFLISETEHMLFMFHALYPYMALPPDRELATVAYWVIILTLAPSKSVECLHQ